jgi:UDP-glucose 4-epimerase
MKVLVTGGAGYIGSHAVKALREAGHEPVVVDNLSRGHRQAVPQGVPFFDLDVRRSDEIAGVMTEQRVRCVMHFAAFASVGESVAEPLLYYDNNAAGTLSLIRACAASGVERFVFSSTCATYGEPEQMPIGESAPQRPVNAYGWSKLFSERMLFDHARSRPGFGFAVLRYFNVAGAAKDGSLGEDHRPETHLVPVILQAALGARDKLTVFGEDYPTPDGTCIRDYVHVEDLVDAHVAVMQALAADDRRVYNLGIGRGYSVREIIEAARHVVGRPFAVETGPRRAGDPPALYADPTLIHTELGWTARVTDVVEIIESAWRWCLAHPNGYL